MIDRYYVFIAILSLSVDVPTCRIRGAMRYLDITIPCVTGADLTQYTHDMEKSQ